MKDKKKVIALSGVILAIAATIGIGTWIGSSKNENDTVVSDKNNEITDSIFKLGDGEELTQSKLNKVIDYMNTYDQVVIQYNIVDNIYDKNNNFIERIYQTEIASNINLKTKTDETYNTSIFYNENGEFDVSDEKEEKAKIKFEDAFGVSYVDCNTVYDVVYKVAEAQGANPQLFIGSKLDTFYYKTFYEEYGQTYYFYKNEKAIEQIDEYDKILNVESRVILSKDNNAESIAFIETVIKYEKDNQIIEKFITMNIWLMTEGEDEECGCGPDTDCNTGEDNGIDCEGDGDC